MLEYNISLLFQKNVLQKTFANDSRIRNWLKESRMLYSSLILKMPDIGGKSNQMSSFLKFSVILMPIAMVFDCVYSSVIRQENLYYGEKEIFRTVDKTGESWIFGIEKGHVNEFLGRYGFRQLMYADAEKLEEIYFTDENKKKSIAGERYSFHCACGETIAVGYSSGRFTPLREIVPDFAFF